MRSVDVVLDFPALGAVRAVRHHAAQERAARVTARAIHRRLTTKSTHHLT